MSDSPQWAGRCIKPKQRRLKWPQLKIKTKRPAGAERSESLRAHPPLKCNASLNIPRYTNARRSAAGVFALVTLSHELLLSNADGLVYYASAAAFDLSIIFLSSRIRPLTPLVVYLQIICAASILANLIGWAMWVMYFDPDVYNNAIGFLYLLAVLAMTHGDGENVRGTDRKLSRCLVFRLHHS